MSHPSTPSSSTIEPLQVEVMDASDPIFNAPPPLPSRKSSASGLDYFKSSAYDEQRRATVPVIHERSDEIFHREETQTGSAARRQQLVKQILTTEEMYVEALGELKRQFIEPLRVASDQAKYDASLEIIHPRYQATLFGNVEQLYELHVKLCRDLRARVRTGGAASAVIGDLFVAFTPYLKMYTQYVHNHKAAEKLLARLRSERRHREFEDFLETRKGDLAALLHEPLERVPLYKKKLEEVLQHTERWHPDFVSINEAIQAADNVVQHINSSQLRHQNQKRIAKIQAAVANCTGPLLTVNRRFVSEGALMLVGRRPLPDGVKVRKPQAVQLFLFNNLLLVASIRTGAFNFLRGRSKYKALHEIGTDKIRKVERVSEDRVYVEDEATRDYRDEQRGTKPAAQTPVRGSIVAALTSVPENIVFKHALRLTFEAADGEQMQMDLNAEDDSDRDWWIAAIEKAASASSGSQLQQRVMAPASFAKRHSLSVKVKGEHGGAIDVNIGMLSPTAAAPLSPLSPMSDYGGAGDGHAAPGHGHTRSFALSDVTTVSLSGEAAAASLQQSADALRAHATAATSVDQNVLPAIKWADRLLSDMHETQAVVGEARQEVAAGNVTPQETLLLRERLGDVKQMLSHVQAELPGGAESERAVEVAELDAFVAATKPAVLEAEEARSRVLMLSKALEQAVEEYGQQLAKVQQQACDSFSLAAGAEAAVPGLARAAAGGLLGKIDALQADLQ